MDGPICCDDGTPICFIEITEGAAIAFDSGIYLNGYLGSTMQLKDALIVKSDKVGEQIQYAPSKELRNAVSYPKNFADIMKELGI